MKILDFGLATLHDSAPPASPSPDVPAETARSLVAGTAGYMAPEQVRGEAVDRRADIFALGAVLYEMLAGRRPFKGDSTLGTLDAVLTRQPPDLSDVNPADPAGAVADRAPVPGQIPGRPVCDGRRCRRPPSTSVIRARNPPPPPSLRALFRRPAVMVTVLLVIARDRCRGLAMARGASRARWARTVAAPEIQRLSNHGDYAEAFLLARQALDVVPDDPHLRQLWLDVSIPAVVTTDRRAPTSHSPRTGRPRPGSPSAGRRSTASAFRAVSSGCGFPRPAFSRSKAPAPRRSLRYRLDPVDAVPPGMVRVVGGRDPVGSAWSATLDDFWIDRFEVTNRQFKEFVDQGGYRRRDYWREPFIDGGRSVPWEEAVARFRDATGRPGPATWTSGTYPDGQADFPVGGVSWYEAAAYAAFAGKSLPTIYHWYRAAGLGRFADILTVSNFSGKGPAPVGSYAGLGPFGTYDMAGNVKEWCWTETNRRRFLLGGAWNEPRYMFADYDARGPFERAPGYGFRLAKYIRPLPPAVAAPVRIEALVRDARKRKPVGDDIFAVYRRQYAYDRAPLNAVVEATEETEIWLKHTVAFDAAYGGERMRAYLFLPKTRIAAVSDRRLFSRRQTHFVLRSSRDMSLSLGGLHHPERTGVPLPGLQRNLRAGDV